MFVNILCHFDAIEQQDTLFVEQCVLLFNSVIPDDDWNLVETLIKMLTIFGVSIVFFLKLLNGNLNFYTCLYWLYSILQKEMKLCFTKLYFFDKDSPMVLVIHLCMKPYQNNLKIFNYMPNYIYILAIYPIAAFEIC